MDNYLLDPKKICKECGGSKFEVGFLGIGSHLHYYPPGSKKTKEGKTVSARACMNCGTILLKVSSYDSFKKNDADTDQLENSNE